MTVIILSIVCAILSVVVVILILVIFICPDDPATHNAIERDFYKESYLDPCINHRAMVESPKNNIVINIEHLIKCEQSTLSDNEKLTGKLLDALNKAVKKVQF